MPLARYHFLNVAWRVQRVAAAPHRLYVILTARCVGEFLSQLADKHVDDLRVRLINAAVELVQELSLASVACLCSARSSRIFVFLVGQMHARAVDLDSLTIQIKMQVVDVNG